MSNPYIQNIERCFLSAVICDPDVMNLLERSNLTPEIIEDPFLRDVLYVMVDLREKGLSLDFVTICYECAMKMRMDNFVDLHDILTAVATSAHAKTHLDIIIRDYKRRTVLEQSQLIQTMAKDDEWEENIEKARALIETVGKFEIGEKPKTQKQQVQELIKDRQDLMNGRKVLDYDTIETGISIIDKPCRPLSVGTGDFNCLLFAATSTGKSSLMAQMISHNVIKGKKVAVFLGETDLKGLYAQMPGQLSRVSIDETDFASEPRDRQADYMWQLEELSQYAEKNLWVHDRDFYIEDIVRTSKKLAEENCGLDLVVIDHMHCLKTRQDFRDERQKFNYISGLLKPLGIELSCPVLTLAQPSRSFKTDNRPPLLSDLKESGNLEDDADRIWALWMPPKDRNGVDQSRETVNPEIWLHQLKFRRGKVLNVPLRLEKRYTRFAGA